MLLREVDQGQNVEKLAAISQFLLGREFHTNVSVKKSKALGTLK